MTKKIEFLVGFFSGFQQLLSGFTGPKRRKMEAILCARLSENQIFTKKMRALPSTQPIVAHGSHKGEIPLDPCRPPGTVVLQGRKFCVLGKIVIV